MVSKKSAKKCALCVFALLATRTGVGKGEERRKFVTTF